MELNGDAKENKNMNPTEALMDTTKAALVKTAEFYKIDPTEFIYRYAVNFRQAVIKKAQGNE